MGSLVRLAIAGGFDPLHEGHVDHIRKAMDLCDELLIFVASDQQLIRKKGDVNILCRGRREIVELVAFGVKEKYSSRCGFILLYESFDEDGSVSSLIMSLRPNYFAKGGDRTPENMPRVEIEACKKVGCTIIYGVGDLLNSSSKMNTRKGET